MTTLRTSQTSVTLPLPFVPSPSYTPPTCAAADLVWGARRICPCTIVAPAPTPSPTFAVGGVKIVISTKLAGFTLESFTTGPQFVYRKTIAAKASTTVGKVIISNIRAATRRRLGEMQGRGLAANAVDFDTSISVADDAAATDMKSKVAAITPAAFLATFVAALTTARASGEFPDLASVNVVALTADIIVSQGDPTQKSVTGVPTPVPTPAPSPSTAMRTPACKPRPAPGS